MAVSFSNQLLFSRPGVLGLCTIVQACIFSFAGVDGICFQKPPPARIGFPPYFVFHFLRFDFSPDGVGGSIAAGLAGSCNHPVLLRLVFHAMVVHAHRGSALAQPTESRAYSHSTLSWVVSVRACSTLLCGLAPFLIFF